MKKCVAVVLWRLANGNSLGAVKSTAVEISKKFCEVLNRYERFFINLAVNRRETVEAIMKFRESENYIITQALGVNDATHVTILAPDSDSQSDYFGRKRAYSVYTQPVTGNNLEFLSVGNGHLGSMHDAKILRNTRLFQRTEKIVPRR